MIQFFNKSKEAPYIIFYKKYEEALKEKQKNIDAICIASYSHMTGEVNARYVNLKIVNDKEFIFFSNYNSTKSNDFRSHNQISALIYWSATNTQIRMKANVKKTKKNFNQDYFSKRDEKKNALAISSQQSSIIDSYDEVQENYHKALKNDNLVKCPDYWGGYSFKPFYFEFWEGNESRINRREFYILKNDSWQQGYLQP